MLAHTNQVPACLVAPSPSERGLGERTERGVRGEDREREEDFEVGGEESNYNSYSKT